MNTLTHVGNLFAFIGGLGMFLYGMDIMASGLQKTAGNKMRDLLGYLTNNRILGVLVGALVTAIIQSSSATTVMVVGFVNAGIMNLTQAAGVIMGANVGTTITAWLVSANEWAGALKPDFFAPFILGIGAFIITFSNKQKLTQKAEIAVGFGILFIGLSSMSSSISVYQDSPIFYKAFQVLGSNPILGILVGAVVTAIIQSSSASVGILQTLAMRGIVNWRSAIFITLGQNIGTCVTAILSSLGAKKNAKTAALMHLLFNVMGTVLFSVVAIVYFQVLNPMAGTGTITQTQISTVHTFFNIATTVLLFPVSNWIIKLAKKIGGVKEDEADRSKVLLDERMLETPSIALQSVINETIRMGEIVRESLNVARNVLHTKSEEDIKLLKEDEDIVDRLCAGITDYTIKLSALQISEREHQTTAHLLQVLSDIERVSDYCENISEFAETMIEKKLDFSDVANEQLDKMIASTVDSYNYALDAFREESTEKALKVIEKETQVDDLEITLRSRHMKRLAKNECNTEAGVVFLDTLVCVERISDHARNIAEEVLGN